MCDETHLSEDFYKQIKTISKEFKALLTIHMYGTLAAHLKAKKLVGATRHLEKLADSQEKYDAQRRKQLDDPDNHYVFDEVDEEAAVYHQRFMAAINDWRDLMNRNGGSKHAAGLAKAKKKKLKVARPYPFVPKRIPQHDL